VAGDALGGGALECVQEGDESGTALQSRLVRATLPASRFQATIKPMAQAVGAIQWIGAAAATTRADQERIAERIRRWPRLNDEAACILHIQAVERSRQAREAAAEAMPTLCTPRQAVGIWRWRPKLTVPSTWHRLSTTQGSHDQVEVRSLAEDHGSASPAAGRGWTFCWGEPALPTGGAQAYATHAGAAGSSILGPESNVVEESADRPAEDPSNGYAVDHPAVGPAGGHADRHADPDHAAEHVASQQQDMPDAVDSAVGVAAHEWQL